jgi:hypothetical protein
MSKEIAKFETDHHKVVVNLYGGNLIIKHLRSYYEEKSIEFSAKLWSKIVELAQDVINGYQNITERDPTFELTVTTSSNLLRRLAIRATLLNGKKIIGFSWYKRNYKSSNWFPTFQEHCYFELDLFLKLINDVSVRILSSLQELRYGDLITDAVPASDCADGAEFKRKRGRPRKTDAGEHKVVRTAKKHRESVDNETVKTESEETEDWSK